MLSEAEHPYNALKCKLGFFAMLRMTTNRRPLQISTIASPLHSTYNKGSDFYDLADFSETQPRDKRWSDFHKSGQPGKMTTEQQKAKHRDSRESRHCESPNAVQTTLLAYSEVISRTSRTRTAQNTKKSKRKSEKHLDLSVKRNIFAPAIPTELPNGGCSSVG